LSKVKERKKKCVEPKVGSRIPLEIAFPIATGKASVPADQNQLPNFSLAVRKHLAICESCREDLNENLGLWYKKGKSAYQGRKAFEILNRSDQGDRTILRKQIASGLGFFEPYRDGSSKGLFVLLTSDNLYDPEEKTLEEFEQLK